MYFVIWWYSVEASTVIYEVEKNTTAEDNIEFCGTYEECTALAQAKNYLSQDFSDI